jgi:hypothetical protein
MVQYMPVKKTILITAVSALTFLSIATGYLAVMSPRRSLDRFLAQVATVQIGKTRLDDWRVQVGLAQLSSLIVKCDQRTCGIGWRGENSLLQKLHLAPRSVVDASVGFEDGIASAIYIVLTVEKRDDKGEWRDDRGVVVQQNTTKISGTCRQHYRLNVLKRYGVGDRYWATVEMDSCVTPDDRARAIAINTSCLTRVSGCKTVESMVPRVFANP